MLQLTHSLCANIIQQSVIYLVQSIIRWRKLAMEWCCRFELASAFFLCLCIFIEPALSSVLWHDTYGELLEYMVLLSTTVAIRYQISPRTPSECWLHQVGRRNSAFTMSQVSIDWRGKKIYMREPSGKSRYGDIAAITHPVFFFDEHSFFPPPPPPPPLPSLQLNKAF